MQVSILLLPLLLVAYSVVATGANEITITHFTANTSTILLKWRKKVGDTHLTHFKVSYVGRRKYYDKRIHIHDIVTYHDRDIHIRDIVTSDESDVVTSHRILLTDLTHCTNYTITLSGWNELTNITNKPLYIRTSAKAVKPVVPSITTQLKSDGRTHAIVTIYYNDDNVGCKKYQLIVVIAENVTAPRQLSSLDEALINQTSYVYIAAEFDDTAPLNIIELGDGKYYGRYLNRPLVPGLCYKVTIRIVYSEDSKLYPTYSELAAYPWCLNPIVPATPEVIDRSTAVQAIWISFGILGCTFLLICISYAIVKLYQKRLVLYGLVYSDKIIKGPSLWDFLRGKKGPTVLEQLISVDYHESQTYEYIDDKDADMLSSEASVVRDFSTSQVTPEKSFETVKEEDSPTHKISSEGSGKLVDDEDPSTHSS